MSPEHAKTISDDRLSKRDVQQYVSQHTKITHPITGEVSGHDPEDVVVIVAGGSAGRSTMALSGWGKSTQSVTVELDTSSKAVSEPLSKVFRFANQCFACYYWVIILFAVIAWL